MKTGCLNWNELTATVATRPRAWRAASTLPAVSTCDMIQPPKMSPCWFASAGIGTSRRTGSLPSGSDICLWSFIAGRLADFPRSRKRRGILDAERARRVARLVDAPHLEVGALEIPDITRDVEQRMRIAIASQALLQFPEFTRVRGKVDRKPLVFRRILRDRLVQSEPMQQARAEARDEMFARESDDRDAAPQGVGAGRVRVPAAGTRTRPAPTPCGAASRSSLSRANISSRASARACCMGSDWTSRSRRMRRNTRGLRSTLPRTRANSGN